MRLLCIAAGSFVVRADGKAGAGPDGAVRMHASRLGRADQPGAFGQLCDPRGQACGAGLQCVPAPMHYAGENTRDARGNAEVWEPVPAHGAVPYGQSIQVGEHQPAMMAMFAALRREEVNVDGTALNEEALRHKIGNFLQEEPHVCLAAPGEVCMWSFGPRDHAHFMDGFMRADGKWMDTCAGEHTCTWEHMTHDGGRTRSLMSKVRRCAQPEGAPCDPTGYTSAAVCDGAECATYDGPTQRYFKQAYFQPPTAASCGSGLCEHTEGTPGFQCGGLEA